MATIAANIQPRFSKYYRKSTVQSLHTDPKAATQSLRKMRDSNTSRYTFYFLYLVFIATIGPLQFGYHLGELNAPQSVITCKNAPSPSTLTVFPQCIPMNTSQWGFVQSIFTVGGFLGALLGGQVATRYGRLSAMRATTLGFIVGPMATALATNIGVMGFGRFMSGLGAGASTVVCPLFIAEVCPCDKRGLFGASTQVMINIGILIAQLLGYFLSHDNMWRIILATAGLIGALELVGLYFVPESPKWLAAHDDPAQARRLLQKIRGDVSIEAEITEWTGIDYRERQPLLGVPSPGANVPVQAPHVSLMEAMRESRYRRAVIVVMAAMFAQQATGINSVVMYSVQILGAIMPSAAALITVLVSAVNVFGTLLCAPLADKIGRKPCLLLSIGGMGTASFLLGLGLTQDVPWLSVFATFSFVTSFGVGLGPVPFILASELVGPEAVGAIQSWGLAACWLATFLVAQFFPILNAALPNGQVFWVFVAIAAVLGLLIAWCLPESKGKATAAEVWGDE